jgi:hypothetical protein
VLFRAGDPGSTLFVVQSGAIELRGPGGPDVPVLAVMEKGDFFGEMSLLEGTARTVTARAAEASELIEISAPLFDRMLRSNPELAVRMLRKLALRLAEAESRLIALPSPTPESETTAAQVAAPPGEAKRMPAGESARPAGPRKGSSSAARPTASRSTAAERPAKARKAEPSPPPMPAPPSASPAPVGAVPPRLVHEQGGEVFPLAFGSVRIGRFDPVTGMRPEVDLTLIDLKRSVSRRHALLTVEAEGARLAEEVGALNGTAVNGAPVEPGESVPLKEGDRIRLGAVELLFSSTSSAGSAPR